MSATISGDALKLVIIHAAPVFCIHVPTFDTVGASHTARKDGLRSGVHGEAAAADAGTCRSTSSAARSFILMLYTRACTPTIHLSFRRAGARHAIDKDRAALQATARDARDTRTGD